VRALLAGGGSAGHTSPLLSTADALGRLAPGTEVVCLGTARGLEMRVIPEAGYRLELIPPVPMPRRPGMDLLRLPVRMAAALRTTHDILTRLHPDVVVGFGGYVSAPAYAVARMLRLPLVIHEGNALPGVANRFGARACTRHVATSFPDTRLPHATFTGLPIRRSISTLDRAASRVEARRRFGLEPDRPTLLVTGGSQGAARINAALGQAAAALAGAGIQVLHVTGPAGSVQLPADRPGDAPPYVVVPFVDRMELAYAAADATIARAGANSVTEAAVLGIPAVFVPLPIGNGEQRLNARAVVAAGGALLVEDAAFTPDWIVATIPGLLNDAARLQRMAAASHGLIPGGADEALARMILAAAS
jgi:UDP-N-acetylglucosamine--N-acetylmuramyl-(pentapeptide) pyrophosphoryl-undecaprenol N-acetylglucosamine transferase